MMKNYHSNTRYVYEDIAPYLTNKKDLGDQVQCACFLCEGGARDGHHLYIRKNPLQLYCHKCNAKSADFFRELRRMGVKTQEQEQDPVVVEERKHIYRFPNGDVAYFKLGKKWSNGKKDYIFAYRDKNDKVITKEPNGSNKLYNLDLMEKADPDTTLYIVEGEKCADALTGKGFLATTANSGAREKIDFSETDMAYLQKFHNVVLIPDNDDKGQEYVKAWPVPLTVLYMTEIWEDCPKKGDIADYIGRGLPVDRIKNWKPLNEEYFDELATAKDIVNQAVCDRIYAIKDSLKRDEILMAAKERATKLKCKRDFESYWKKYLYSKTETTSAYHFRTRFPDQALELDCGNYECDANGVHYGTDVIVPHPIMPLAIYSNLETQMEKISIGFYKSEQWKNIVVERGIVANASKITNLANYGIEVTSETAKKLVRFLSEVVASNYKVIPRIKSVSHLGWVDGRFTPYEESIKIDNEANFRFISESIKASGSLEEWISIIRPLRENLILRLVMAASAAAPLVKLTHSNSFILHLWGGTGSGKTVALMAAASIWGNPVVGKLVRTINGTQNAMLKTASFLCNLPFFGDELQTIKTTVGYDRLIMNLTEGNDRARMNDGSTMQEQGAWQTAFLFTGEEPCTRINSGGGVKNRVIEIECNEPVVRDGRQTVTEITNCYGQAGKRLIDEYMKNVDLISSSVKTYVSNLINETNTTEKQASAMALLLAADDALWKMFGRSEKILTVDMVKPFLKTIDDVNVGERCYKIVMDLINANRPKFLTVLDEHHDGKEELNTIYSGEIWGKINKRKGSVYFNASILKRELLRLNFDFDSVKKHWKDKGYIENNEGRYIFTRSVNGIKGQYVVLKILT